MSQRLYHMEGTVAYFNPSIVELNKAVSFPSNTSKIIFSNIQHIRVDLILDNLPEVYLDMEKVLTVGEIVLSAQSTIYAPRLYWANYITLTEWYTNERIKYLRINAINKELVYLSGKVVGQLGLRFAQRKILYDKGYAVYSPGNHITVGDPIADANPGFVYELDIMAMNAADVFVFDLSIMSAGTCAELGMAVALGFHESKRMYYMNYTDEGNFFINGLLKNLVKIDSLDDLGDATSW